MDIPLPPSPSGIPEPTNLIVPEPANAKCTPFEIPGPTYLIVPEPTNVLPSGKQEPTNLIIPEPTNAEYSPSHITSDDEGNFPTTMEIEKVGKMFWSFVLVQEKPSEMKKIKFINTIQ